MKQSEPVNPRSLRTGRSAALFHGSAIAAEISGYVAGDSLQKSSFLGNEPL